jgi:hypothetical protein
VLVIVHSQSLSVEGCWSLFIHGWPAQPTKLRRAAYVKAFFRLFWVHLGTASNWLGAVVIPFTKPVSNTSVVKPCFTQPGLKADLGLLEPFLAIVGR